jgi:hypothetical protein
LVPQWVGKGYLLGTASIKRHNFIFFSQPFLMTTSLKTLFAAATLSLSLGACSTDTTKNADGSTTTEVTTPSAEQVGDKMENTADKAGDKMEAAGDKMDAKMEEAGDKMDAAADKAKANAQEAGAKMDAKMDAAGNKMDAMGDAAAKSASQTKENMKAAAKQ